MYDIFANIVTLVRLGQYEQIPLPRFVALVGIVIDFKLKHMENAPEKMVVTLSGMDILYKF